MKNTIEATTAYNAARQTGNKRQYAYWLPLFLDVKAEEVAEVMGMHYTNLLTALSQLEKGSDRKMQRSYLDRLEAQYGETYG